MGTKISTVEQTITELQDKNTTLKGVVQRQSEQLKILNDRVAMLTARSMERNITISGLTGDNHKENCKTTVINFFKQKVEIDAEPSEIFVAHRVGQQRENQNRIMLVRCNENLKNRIFCNIKNLKDKTNEKDEYYYINKQLPDQLAKQNREIHGIVKQQRDRNNDLPPKDRSKIEVKNRTVLLDGEPHQKMLQPVEINELFPDKTEKEKQDRIKVVNSDTFTEEKSSFTAYAIKTGQVHEVHRTYRKIRRLNQVALHVVAAYNLKNNNKGYQDEAEHGAGHRLLNMLESTYSPNISIFIVRIYGGKHPGQKRFKIMSDVAKQALERLGAEKKK